MDPPSGSHWDSTAFQIAALLQMWLKPKQHLAFLNRCLCCYQVEDESSNGSTLWALVKGAPEIVQPFLRDAPPDYEKSYKRYASEGAR